MNNCPCWNNGNGCDKRTVKPNCHDTCQEYKDWLADRAEMQIKNASQKAYLGYYCNIISKNREKKK